MKDIKLDHGWIITSAILFSIIEMGMLLCSNRPFFLSNSCLYIYIYFGRNE